MKICYIADATSIHIVTWVKYFAQMGHEIYLITDTKNQIEGIKTFYIGECLPKIHIPLFSATYQILKKSKKIRKLLKTFNPDILHAHYATNYGYLSAKTGFHPFILTCHGSDILVDFKRNPIEKFFVKYALKNADLITLPSEQMKNIAEEITSNSSKIIQIQYGIDISEFSYHFQYSMPIKVISTRNLTSKYRIDVLINAIPKVINNNSEIKFLILGDGNESYNLLNLTKKLNIHNYIEFPGNISHKDISEYYQQAHIYVTTSPSDGISISLLEAFSTGCYPIVPDNPSNRSLAEMGFEMSLFEINNPNSLAIVFKDMLNKAGSIGEKTVNNRKLVEKHFSREKNLSRFNEIYEEFKK